MKLELQWGSYVPKLELGNEGKLELGNEGIKPNQRGGSSLKSPLPLWERVRERDESDQCSTCSLSAWA